MLIVPSFKWWGYMIEVEGCVSLGSSNKAIGEDRLIELLGTRVELPELSQPHINPRWKFLFIL